MLFLNAHFLVYEDSDLVIKYNNINLKLWSVYFLSHYLYEIVTKV